MSTDIVGSNMSPFASEALKPSGAGYGQNGFGGASSDTPGKSTTSGFLPKTDLAAAQADRKLVQQRPISAEPLPTTFGQHAPRKY